MPTMATLIQKGNPRLAKLVFIFDCGSAKPVLTCLVKVATCQIYPMAYFTYAVDPTLAKLWLNFNGSLNKLVLMSLVK